MLAATRRRCQAIAQLRAQLDAGAATADRDLLLALMAGQTQLFGSALTLERLRIESAKPDAQRESGYQQRDLALIEGV
jgi:hypothetical protein